MNLIRYLHNIRPSWPQIGLGMLAGALLSFAYPPMEQIWAGFAGLVILARLTWSLSPGRVWMCGLASGIVLRLATLYWLMAPMTDYGQVPFSLALLPLTLFSFVLGCFHGVWAALVSYLRQKGLSPILTAPVIWVASEWIQSWILTGFPWLPLGQAWLPVPALLQSAEIWGVFGLSGLVALYSMLAARASLWPGKRPGKKEAAAALAALLLVAGAYLWGDMRIGQVRSLSQAAPKLTVSSVQGDVFIPDMWDEKKKLPIVMDHVRLSVEESKKVTERPWLLVWSESAAPFFMVSEPQKTQPMLDFARQHKAAVLAGTMGSVYLDQSKKKIGITNRSFLVDDKGRAASFYDKVHLVPFGEYVPYNYIFFWVRAVAAVSQDFSPGKEGSVIDYGPAKLGPLICYESIFPELAREQHKRGALLMVNQTNDAWFGRTAASRQHMSHLVLRSIENRTACVRSANSGISGFIHPDGSISSPTGLFVKAVVTEKLPLMKIDTVYTAYGHLVGPVSLALVLGLILIGWLKGRKKAV